MARKASRTTLSSKGFTIVELLIVVVVIAILATITIVSYNGITQQARDAERKQDMADFQKMLEIYYAQNNTYPLSSQLSDATWRKANLTAQGDGMFINPQHAGGSYSVNAAGSVVTIDRYSYYPRLADTGHVCTTAGLCKGYAIVYKLEAAPTTNISIVVLNE